MNKFLYCFLSVAICLLSIFATLFVASYMNFYVWLSLVIFILIMPIVFHKKFTETKIVISKEFSVLLVQFEYFLVLCLAVTGVLHILPDNYLVAVTKSPAKANEIQELLTNPYRSTQRIILHNIDDNTNSIGIEVKKLTRKENRKATLELLNSDVLDKTVTLRLDVPYTKNKKRVLKNITRETEYILHGIDGVEYVYVDIKVDDFDSPKAAIESVKIEYGVDETADSEKIRSLIEKFIKFSFPKDVKTIEIKNTTFNPNWLEILEKAGEYYENGDYAAALKLLQNNNKDNKFNGEISSINKIIELNKKIKYEPNNYKYYIELADLQSSVCFMYCPLNNYNESINNYQKALALNPKAYEVYEKIGDVYYRDRHIAAPFDKKGKPQIDKEYEAKAVEYFEKAIKYSKATDLTYTGLGYICLDNKDYEKALEYFNKIDEKAESEDCKGYFSNQKVYLNLKTGRYKEAFKHTKNCTTFLCRLMRFDFFEKDSCN